MMNDVEDVDGDSGLGDVLSCTALSLYSTNCVELEGPRHVPVGRAQLHGQCSSPRLGAVIH